MPRTDLTYLHTTVTQLPFVRGYYRKGLRACAGEKIFDLPFDLNLHTIFDETLVVISESVVPFILSRLI